MLPWLYSRVHTSRDRFDFSGVNVILRVNLLVRIYRIIWRMSREDNFFGRPVTRFTDSCAACIDLPNGGLWDIDNFGDISQRVSWIGTQAQCLPSVSWWSLMCLYHSIKWIVLQDRVNVVGCGGGGFVLDGCRVRDFNFVPILFVGIVNTYIPYCYPS